LDWASHKWALFYDGKIKGVVMGSVLQPWVHELPLMQQSVLIASVRGPDGIKKDHPVKVLCRWLRRSFLISAFDGKALDDPYVPGGGSFTGPCVQQTKEGLTGLDWHAKEYLRCVDELPHHFQLHLMHAAEILGYKHPNDGVRIWWNDFYLSIVNDAHLVPETKEKMEFRLGDKEKQWRSCEEVTAK
jgi:hypothetical protein